MSLVASFSIASWLCMGVNNASINQINAHSVGDKSDCLFNSYVNMYSHFSVSHKRPPHVFGQRQMLVDPGYLGSCIDRGSQKARLLVQTRNQRTIAIK